MREADDVQVRHRGEAFAVEHRLGQDRIVVARQQHHRQLRGGDHRRRAVDQFVRQAMAVEGVAGEQHDVGADAARRIEHAGETTGAVAAMELRGIDVIHMDVGCVYDDYYHLDLPSPLHQFLGRLLVVLEEFTILLALHHQRLEAELLGARLMLLRVDDLRQR